ncbi:MAG: tetratricopeptide repeat protein [Bacteroidia bacterium]
MEIRSIVKYGYSSQLYIWFWRTFLSVVLIILTATTAIPQQLTVEKSRERAEVFRQLQQSKRDTNYVNLCYKYGEYFEGIINDTALYWYEKARVLSRDLGYVHGLVRYFDYKNSVLTIQSEYDQILSNADTAYQMCVKYGERRWQAIQLNRIGTVYQYKTEMRKAADHYLRAFSIAEQLKDTMLMNALAGNLSGVLIEIKDYAKSRYFAAIGYELAEKQHDTLGMGYALVNLATSDEFDSLYDASKARSWDAYKIGMQYNDISLVQFALSGYANALRHLRQSDSAIVYFKKLIEISKGQNNDFHLVHNLHDLGATYQYIGDYAAAKAVLTEALPHALIVGNHSLLMSLYDGLSIAEERLGNYQAALQARKNSGLYRDSLELSEQFAQVNELESKYQNEKKSRELAEKELILQAEKSKSDQRLGWLLISGLGLIVLLLIIYFRTRIARQKVTALQKDMEVKELMAREDERSRLAADMHDDLGAGLSTIRMISELAMQKNAEEVKQDIRRISTRSEELVESMRQMIWAMSNNSNSLEDLVVYIRGYTRQYLDDHDVQVEFIIPDLIPQMQVTGPVKRNLFLVVKEILHNVIKHSGAKKIRLEMFISDHSFSIIIADDGKGIQATTQNRFGNGLKNIERRMKEILGEVRIEGEEGTTVTLRLNF